MKTSGGEKLRAAIAEGKRRAYEQGLAHGLSERGRRLLTVNEAADYFGCDRKTIYRLVNKGDLVPLHVSSRKRFRLSDLDAYAARGAARR